MSDSTRIYKFDQPFVTESGYTFKEPEIAFQTWGELNEERDNVIVVCHALTGNSAADEWFEGLFAPHGVLNPETHYIVCANVPGSCYGSTGPHSINPETGKVYGPDFPVLSIRDMVRFQQVLLDHLDIEGIELVIGGSMGGMQALEFVVMDPRVQSAACIAMGKAHSAWAIGLSHAQRQAIYGDPKWEGGHYSLDDPPLHGLGVARMVAMASYRSPSDFEKKFARAPQPDSDLFQIESYLNHQGKKLADRFDPLSYVRLTQAMDLHDVTRGRGAAEQVLNRVRKPVLVIGIDSDLLYPTEEQKELAELLPEGQYAEINSPHGHDSFLIEFEQTNEILRKHLTLNNEPIQQL